MNYALPSYATSKRKKPTKKDLDLPPGGWTALMFFGGAALGLYIALLGNF